MNEIHENEAVDNLFWDFSNTPTDESKNINTGFYEIPRQNQRVPGRAFKLTNATKESILASSGSLQRISSTNTLSKPERKVTNGPQPQRRHTIQERPSFNRPRIRPHGVLRASTSCVPEYELTIQPSTIDISESTIIASTSTLANSDQRTSGGSSSTSFLDTVKSTSLLQWLRKQFTTKHHRDH
ncbi:hypothetical protein BC833DRAFT_566736 [Globomyces pollinis-pini]|nr:hypothetical protein BC833DRAFT_566736 [Globomyces pollinis-pini]